MKTMAMMMAMTAAVATADGGPPIGEDFPAMLRLTVLGPPPVPWSLAPPPRDLPPMGLAGPPPRALPTLMPHPWHSDIGTLPGHIPTGLVLVDDLILWDPAEPEAPEANARLLGYYGGREWAASLEAKGRRSVSSRDRTLAASAWLEIVRSRWGLPAEHVRAFIAEFKKAARIGQPPVEPYDPLEVDDEGNAITPMKPAPPPLWSEPLKVRSVHHE